MSSERFAKAGELFDSALAMPSEGRTAYLKQACGEDQLLLAEVESLLTAHQQAKGFMQSPAFKYVELMPPGDQLSEGQKVGAYRIVREIRRGGMGAVYLAERADKQFTKYVAIKLVKRGMDTDYILRHFRNERQILATFDHPNIAALLDGGSTENGLPYFVMEYVEGKPIDQYCVDNKLNITQRLQLFQQVCSAVAYAHRNLVIHRDIKPSNILVTSDGVPKLLDFGIAKIMHADEAGVTATGMHFMTPEFASPEQAQGQPVTTLNDVYSLGVVLYELLTGHSPYGFKNLNAIEIVRVITETQPQLPSAIIYDVKQRRQLRVDLDNIVMMALRKEPQRRYQSVDQLSEDIRRHVQGLPITAHKDTLAYRVSKFVLRNRIAVAIVVLAVVTLALSAAIMQWRANKQAKLFQEFGQEVSQIEATMRYAYLLPLHSIEREKKNVQDQLLRMKTRMEAIGSVAYGPGYYSLGRGYLSLHQYQDAYDNLILAWQKHKYQEPAAANALGLSMAMLYQEKLREAAQLYNKEQFYQRKSELEKLYRLPAKQYIQRGADASEAPEYVQALLAFLEKQYQEAFDKAHVAEEKISWHYESRKLQGDILAATAKDHSSTGKTNAAIELYEKAKRAYLEAALKGESDPQIYEGLCALHSALQKMHLDQEGTSPSTVVDEGISYCKKAILADSGNTNANLFAADIYTDLAYDQYLHGFDCTAATEKAVRFANAVLKTDSENGAAYRALGNAYKTLAAAEIQKGGNPFESLKNAGFNLEKSSETMPENAELLSNLGTLYIHRAQYEHNAGKNGTIWIEKAIQKLQKAVDLNPKDSKYHCNLGIAYFRKGYIEEESGMAPDDSLKRSIQECEKSISLNAVNISPYQWAGSAANNLAYKQMKRGANPIAAMDYSLKMKRKALEFDPDNAYSHSGLGYSFLFKGQYLVSINKDPSKELYSARESFKKSIQFNNKVLSSYEGLAEVELQFARYAMRKNRSPRSYFENANEILDKRLKIGPQSFHSYKLFAELHFMKAENSILMHQSPATEIRNGIEAANRALRLNPKMAEVHSNRGNLFLLRARLQSGSARVEAAQEAVASFDKAFTLDRNLRKELANQWEEAKRFATK